MRRNTEAPARAVRLPRSLALVASGVLFLASPAGADEAKAAAFFRAATAAYAKADYGAAAVAFEAAYREVPHPATLYNAGLAWELAHQPARAADAFAAAMSARDRLTEAQATDGSHRLARLEAELGTLAITAPSGSRVRVAGNSELSAPATLHSGPGDAEITIVYADESRATRIVQIAAGERQKVRFDLPARPPPIEPAPRVPDTTRPAPTPDRGDPGKAMRVAGWMGIGTGLALAGVGAGLGFGALDARDEFYASGLRDPASRDRADSLRTATNVAFVGAALLGATGVVLLVAAPSARKPPVALGVGPTGARLIGSF